MRIEDIVIADSAWAGGEKIDARGIIMGGLTLETLPTHYRSLSVAFAVILEPSEGDAKRLLGALLFDPSGIELRDAETHAIYPDFSHPDAKEFYIPIALTFDNIPFAVKGDYTIRITADGGEVATTSFRVYPGVSQPLRP